MNLPRSMICLCCCHYWINKVFYFFSPTESQLKMHKLRYCCNDTLNIFSFLSALFHNNREYHLAIYKTHSCIKGLKVYILFFFILPYKSFFCLFFSASSSCSFSHDTMSLLFINLYEAQREWARKIARGSKRRAFLFFFIHFPLITITSNVVEWGGGRGKMLFFTLSPPYTSHRCERDTEEENINMKNKLHPKKKRGQIWAEVKRERGSEWSGSWNMHEGNEILTLTLLWSLLHGGI